MCCVCPPPNPPPPPRAQSVLSALAHWSPVFGEAEFVPALAYPFVSLFQVDDLAAFETVMAVLLRWCGSWLSTFPHPPIPVLNAVEQIITKFDPALMKHLGNVEVGSQTFAWSLLRSGFTEVLNKGEWLRLWDHLFTNSEDPGLLLCAVAAYSVCNRNAIMGGKAKGEVEAFYRRQNAINMGEFLGIMYEIRGKCPADLLGGGGGATGSEGGDVLGSVLSGVDTVWPIPRGMYVRERSERLASEH